MEARQCEAANYNGQQCIRRIRRPEQTLCWQHRVPAATWRKPFEERLARFVDTSDTDNCWMWTGPIDDSGYGKVQWGRATLSAHRVVFTETIGPIPDGLHLDHLCKRPACVNPQHLEPVTPRENWRRSNAITVLQAQQTHCKYGHEFDEANTRRVGGKRWCRACDRRRAREHKARKQATTPARTDPRETT